jgi:hypothetical protein
MIKKSSENYLKQSNKIEKENWFKNEKEVVMNADPNLKVKFYLKKIIRSLIVKIIYI